MIITHYIKKNEDVKYILVDQNNKYTDLYGYNRNTYVILSGTIGVWKIKRKW